MPRQTDQEEMIEIYQRLQDDIDLENQDFDSVLDWLTGGAVVSKATAGVRRLADNLTTPYNVSTILQEIDKNLQKTIPQSIEEAGSIEELDRIQDLQTSNLRKEVDKARKEIAKIKVLDRASIGDFQRQIQNVEDSFEGFIISEANDKRVSLSDIVRQEAQFVQESGLVRETIKGRLSGEEQALAEQIEGELQERIESARNLSELESIDTSIALTRASERGLDRLIRRKIK